MSNSLDRVARGWLRHKKMFRVIVAGLREARAKALTRKAQATLQRSRIGAVA
jgi:hypothetical protein